MSLTEIAYRERKWGWLPALRKALEDKSVPSKFEYYYGPTSADDNIFDSTNRLLEIAILTIENETAIRNNAKAIGLDEMHDDLIKLERALGQVSHFLHKNIEKVKNLNNTL